MDFTNGIEITEILNEETKRKYVLEFAPFLFYHHTIKDIVNLSEKIAKRAIVISARKEDKVVGFIAYYRNDDVNRIAYITLIVVHPKFRENGIGKVLLQSAIKDCLNKDYKIIRLEVDNANYNAIKLYQNIGFQIEKAASEHSTYYICYL